MTTWLTSTGTARRLPARVVMLLIALSLLAAACAPDAGDAPDAGGQTTAEDMDGMDDADGDEGMEGMDGDADEGMGGMGMGDMAEDVPRLPPVFGYYDGQDVFFVHPEASDPEIAGLLDDMMGSPVPVVAALAQVPDAALADLYVFANGVQPDDAPSGPLGFQADVFDSVPGEDGYSPLRRVLMVTWGDDADAQLLTSVGRIRDAEDDGEVTVADSGAVINAPLLSWPGGQR